MPNGNVSYSATLESFNLATLQTYLQQEFQQPTSSIVLSNFVDRYYVRYSVSVSAFTTAGQSNPITEFCDTEQGGLLL